MTVALDEHSIEGPVGMDAIGVSEEICSSCVPSVTPIVRSGMGETCRVHAFLAAPRDEEEEDWDEDEEEGDEDWDDEDDYDDEDEDDWDDEDDDEEDEDDWDDEDDEDYYDEDEDWDEDEAEEDEDE